MPHIRKHLRDWLKANLTGSALAGDRVFVRRTLPLERNLQPSLIVAVQNERSADASMDGVQQRTVEVRITACVKGDCEAGEDMLDALGVFVEGKFAADPTLGGLAETYEYQATEFAFGGDAERSLCTAAFTFAVTLLTNRGNPETSL